MARFTCEGTITNRVIFILEAVDYEDARQKALAGDWEQTDPESEVAKDWNLDLRTLAPLDPNDPDHR